MHYAVQCEKSIPERKAIAMQRNLCMNCFQIGHIAANCKLPMKCKTCEKDLSKPKHASAFCQTNADDFARRKIARRSKNHNTAANPSNPAASGPVQQ
jgi:hypothetical protein